MAQKKLSIPFLVILILGLVATVVLGAIITRQLENKDISSDEIPSPSITATPQPTISPAASPAATIIQPKVPKPTYPEGWKEYHNEKYGYSFAYPPTVMVNGYSHETTIYEYQNMGYVAVKGIDAIGGVDVLEMNLDDAIKHIAAYEESLALPRYIYEKKEVTYIGYNGIQFISLDRKKTIRTTFFVTENNKRSYVLGWSEPLYKVDELGYKLFGKQILATFHID